LESSTYGDSLWPPGYPFFLAALMRLCGESISCVLLAQVLLGVLTVHLVYRTALRVAGPWPALAAAAYMALQPDLANHTSKVLSETLFIFLIALAVFLMVRGCVGASRRSWHALGSGLCLGAAALARGSLLPLLPLLVLGAVWFWRTGSRLGPQLAAVSLGMVLCLAPWTIRNYALFGKITPVSSNGGMNFYYGTVAPFVLSGAEGEDSFSRLAPEIKRLRAEYRLSREQWPPEEAFWREYGRALSSDPLQFAKLRLVSLYDFWTPWPRYAGRSLAKKLVMLVSLAPLYLFAGMGLARLKRSGDRAVWFLPLAIGGTLTAVHTFAFATHRFFMPLIPLLALLAALGVAEAQERLQGGRLVQAA
jgi:4-amino-4-deoxy-L-arabinose transferase-like glycosyltransferase